MPTDPEIIGPGEFLPITKTVEDPRDRIIREMADEIREMDTLIWQMSQCMSWEAMRQYFVQLQVKMERRRKAESDRIDEIMRQELISVYTKPKDL